MRAVALRMRGGQTFHPACLDYLTAWADYEGPRLVEVEQAGWPAGVACACCEGMTAEAGPPLHTTFWEGKE